MLIINPQGGNNIERASANEILKAVNVDLAQTAANTSSASFAAGARTSPTLSGASQSMQFSCGRRYRTPVQKDRTL